MVMYVRLRIPNGPDTVRVLDEGDLERMLSERPTFLTNRYYVLDRERFGDVPMTAGGAITVHIMDATLDGDSIVLDIVINEDEIRRLVAEHGDPAPGYAVVRFGETALRFFEIGLAPR